MLGSPWPSRDQDQDERDERDERDDDKAGSREGEQADVKVPGAKGVIGSEWRYARRGSAGPRCRAGGRGGERRRNS